MRNISTTHALLAAICVTAVALIALPGPRTAYFKWRLQLAHDEVLGTSRIDSITGATELLPLSGCSETSICQLAHYRESLTNEGAIFHSVYELKALPPDHATRRAFAELIENRFPAGDCLPQVRFDPYYGDSLEVWDLPERKQLWLELIADWEPLELGPEQE